MRQCYFELKCLKNKESLKGDLSASHLNEETQSSEACGVIKACGDVHVVGLPDVDNVQLKRGEKLCVHQ